MKFFKFLHRLNQQTRGFLLIAVLCLLVIAAVAGGVHRVRDVEGFLEGTTLGGEDISGRSVEKIAGGINDKLVGAQVELTENGETVLKGTLADFGHDFDEQKFLEDLKQEEEEQKHDLSTTFKRLVENASFELTDYYADDSEQLKRFVVSTAFQVPRVESADAYIRMNEETELYEVVPPVQGNEIDDAKLQEYVENILDEAIQKGSFLDNPVLTISIPQEMYTSREVSTDTEALKKEALKKNQELLVEDFKDVTITYTFGSQTEVLEGSEITNWIKVNEDLEIEIDEDKVAEFVNGLADQYDTRLRDRAFVADDGRIVHITPERNLYGYSINVDAEIAALEEDIYNRESVTREPVYFEVDEYRTPLYISRDGNNDMTGTYVEVCITKQHLWFYKDGALVIESDVVTGDAGSEETATRIGCYPLAEKASPATLTGANSVDFWSSEVGYWMAFNGDQGLHDAPWRSEFGKEIYKGDGSHGCVNLPSDVAATIFENIKLGTPVFVYQ